MGKMDIQKKKRIAAIACAAVFLVFAGAVCWLVGKPMIEFVSEPEKFRAWVDQSGIWGRLAFVGMMAFQIVLAFIPGEPLEIGAVYAFGAVEGTGLCLLGALLGSVTVFLFVKKFGMRFVALFVSEEKIRSLKFLQNEKRLNLIAYILFLIPGTPKDVMTYIVGLTPMKLSFWIFITLTARIPSVITSTIGGDALGTQNYLFAVIVFAATAVLSGLGILLYRCYMKKREERDRREKAEKIPQAKRISLCRQTENPVA